MAATGLCSRTTRVPRPTARRRARSRVARSAARSPAPTACAVRPAVPRRRKPKPQNTKSNTTAAAAMAPSRAGSPRRPMTVASAKPSSGVDMLASVIGSARRITAAWVTATRCAWVIGGSGGRIFGDIAAWHARCLCRREPARGRRARRKADHDPDHRRTRDDEALRPLERDRIAFPCEGRPRLPDERPSGTRRQTRPSWTGTRCCAPGTPCPKKPRRKDRRGRSIGGPRAPRPRSRRLSSGIRWL